MYPENDDNDHEEGLPRRSAHAEQRGREGRPTSPAFNDAQNARKSAVFIDEETGRYVLRGAKGREHVFETDGEHVTSVVRSNRVHQARLKRGRIRAVMDREFEQFREIFT